MVLKIASYVIIIQKLQPFLVNILYAYFKQSEIPFQRIQTMFRPQVKLPGDRPEAPPPYSEVTMQVTPDGAVHV